MEIKEQYETKSQKDNGFEPLRDSKQAKLIGIVMAEYTMNLHKTKDLKLILVYGSKRYKREKTETWNSIENDVQNYHVKLRQLGFKTVLLCGG